MNMRLFVTLLLSVMGVACEHALDLGKEHVERECRFNVHTSSFTRSGKDVFSVGDSIGIYAVKRSENGKPAIPAQAGNQAHNAKWIKTEEGWQPASPMDKVLWSQDDCPLDFYAYYPYQRSASDPAAINFSVNLNQTSEEIVGESDLLRAANTRGLTEGDVELQFEHMFSLLEIKLTGDILPDPPVKLTANEIVTSVLLDLGTGNLSPVATGKVLSCCVDSMQMLYRMILPSQDVEEGTAFLSCESGDITYMYRSPGITLEPACLQKFEIEVK